MSTEKTVLKVQLDVDTLERAYKLLPMHGGVSALLRDLLVEACDQMEQHPSFHDHVVAAVQRRRERA